MRDGIEWLCPIENPVKCRRILERRRKEKPENYTIPAHVENLKQKKKSYE